jgi:hypothetical protein
MVHFQTKNPSFGKFWKALDWKILIYFMVIWNILRTFRIFYDHLAHFYGFSGNPGSHEKTPLKGWMATQKKNWNGILFPKLQVLKIF